MMGVLKSSGRQFFFLKFEDDIVEDQSVRLICLGYAGFVLSARHDTAPEVQYIFFASNAFPLYTQFLSFYSLTVFSNERPGADHYGSSKVTVLLEKGYPLRLFHFSVVVVQVEPRVWVVTRPHVEAVTWLSVEGGRDRV